MRIEAIDYELPPELDSVWVQVGALSVYIRRAETGVAVDIYQTGREMDDPIIEAFALNPEHLENTHES